MELRNFRIEFDSNAAREFKKICKHNPVLISRFTKTIDSLSLSPFQGKPLAGNKKGCYSLREGEYRIIYEVYPSQNVVFIIRIGHRREVYR